MATCGMYICKKCGVMNIVFGVLILVVGLGLWEMLLGNAPGWWNAWTLIGIYLGLWGIMASTGKEH